MQFINMNYGLHDTVINNIDENGEFLCLYFANGVYHIDSTGKELNVTSKCRMEINIIGFNERTAYKYVEIYRYYKNKFYEMKYIDFKKLLKQSIFDIEFDYYSGFNNSIMLIGYIGKYKIELKITDIHKINFYFD